MRRSDALSFYNAFVIIPRKSMGLAHVDEDKIPEDSQVWRYEGSTPYRVHLLRKRPDETYEAIKPPSWSANLPETLYQALFWDEARELFRADSDLLNKINTGLTIALVGILTFFCYLMYSSITGG